MDAVVDVIKENIPSVFLMETLGRALALPTFYNLWLLARAVKLTSSLELKEVVKKKGKLLEELNRFNGYAKAIIDVIRKILKEEPLPEAPPPSFEVVSRVKYVKSYSKVRKKGEVKLKDLKDVMHKVVTFIG